MRISKFFKQNEKPTTPKIVIRNPEILHQLITLVTEKDIEIMLLGVVEQEENATYNIIELLIPPMDSNSSAFVTTDDEKFGEWLYKIPREKRNKMRMHLHTHPKMAVTPSGIDETMIRDKVENISDFYIRIIANKNLNFRVDFFDLKNKTLYEELTLYHPIETNYGQHLMWFNTEDQGYYVSAKDTEAKKVLIKKLDSMIKEKPKPVYKTPHYRREYMTGRNYFSSDVVEEEEIDEYGLCEHPLDFLDKMQDFEEMLMYYGDKDEENIISAFTEAFYTIDAAIEGAKHKVLEAITTELTRMTKFTFFNEMTPHEISVNYYADQLIPVLQWATGEKQVLKEKQKKMNLEEWLKDAKYFTTPRLLQSSTSE